MKALTRRSTTLLASLALMLPGAGAASAQQPSEVLLVPHFEVATDNPNGLTTLFAVRNETAAQQSVAASFFDALGALQSTLAFDLGPKEVRTFNIRDVPGLALDADDVARGYAVIEPDEGASGLLLSGDWFSVTADEDFATGHTLADFTETTEALCVGWTARYLNGGPFSGGTLFTFWVEEPQGVELTDPPTVLGTVYDEEGVELGTFEVRTAFQSFQMPADGLAFTAPFGSVDLTFNNTRGLVFSDHSASGRFSVGFQASCLDTLPQGLVQK